MAETTTLEITGMTCQGCVTALTRALSRLPGVEGVTVDLAANTARATRTAPTEVLIAAAEPAGYGAKRAA